MNTSLILKSIGALMLFTAVMVLPTGCLFKSSEDTSVEDAKELTTTATTNIEPTFDKIINGEFAYGQSEWPGLTESYNDFNEAATLDPNNSEAKFGAALTGMMLAVQNEEMHTLLDEAEITSPAQLAKSPQLPAMKLSVLQQAAKRADFPEFHEFQDAIADSVLPVLDKAIEDLADVYADEAFSLTLTIDGEVQEIDHAEVGILLAGFKALRALVTLPLSYDIDIDQAGSYDFIDEISGIGDIEDFSTLTPAQEAALNHVTSLLTPGSAFLTARNEYAARLARVDDELVEAVTLVKEVLNSLSSETDDQTDDILRLCTDVITDDCIQQAELDDALTALDSVLKYIGGPVDIYVDELDTTLNLNPSAFLGNVQDYKKFLPYYAFYTASEWSEEKPVIYFTNAAGTLTGSLKDLADIFADTTLITNEEIIAQVRQIVILQDPTFQGFFHNGTADGFWYLITIIANNGDTAIPVAGTIVVETATPVDTLATLETFKSPNITERAVLNIMDPQFVRSFLTK